MKIAIDISRALENKATGIHNYQYYLFKHISKIDPETEYIPFYYGTLNPSCETFMGRKIMFNSNKFISNRLVFKNLYDKFLIKGAFYKNKVDLLHSTAYITIAGLESKTLLTVHDLIFLNDKDSYDHSTAEMIKKSIYKVKKIIAISETTKKEIKKTFPSLADKKIRVIYQGIDEDIERITNPLLISDFKEKILGDREMRFILFLGSFTKRKNINNILRAFKKILTNNIHYKLVLAGKPLDAYMEVLLLINDLKLNNQVVVMNYLPKEQISLLLSSAEAFIFPSFYEGFGLPVLEAMKCGIPVITSNVSSLQEIFSDAALAVHPNDVNEIADAILYLLNNNELRNRLILAGLKKASEFTWRKTAAETLKLYKEVI